MGLRAGPLPTLIQRALFAWEAVVDAEALPHGSQAPCQALS